MKRTNNVHRANSLLYKDFAYENTFEKIAVLFLEWYFPCGDQMTCLLANCWSQKKERKKKKATQIRTGGDL